MPQPMPRIFSRSPRQILAGSKSCFSLCEHLEGVSEMMSNQKNLTEHTDQAPVAVDGCRSRIFEAYTKLVIISFKMHSASTDSS